MLLREVGGAGCIADQVEHLRRLSRQTHVEVRVLPWSTGAHVAMKGAFTILGFDDPDLPDVVYLEMEAGSRYEEKDNSVRVYSDMFATLRGQSVTIEEFLG